MKTSLIGIEIGNKIKEISSGRIGKLRDFKLTPNGINDPKLVAILFVEMNGERGKSVISATADKFEPIDDEGYIELFPSVHVNKISDSLK